jgi:glycosyltransferase involved in cell wall biosynthesis
MTDGAAPLVSILTPSFNQGRFIGRCLASVAAQTYRPLEHVVRDGGSTDETLELLRGAAAHVSWTSEPDSGQAEALNKAFAASSGAFVGWLNSDDAYADRRAVERAVKLFGMRPHVDVVFGHALLVNEQDEVLQVLTALPFSEAVYRLVHYVIQPTLFIRRTALDREPYFVREDLQFVLDRDLILRLSRHSHLARAPGVTAIDRHQRDRKVLQNEFPAEAAAFDAALGVRTGRRAGLIRRGVLLVARAGGAVVMARLPATLVPTLEIRVRPLVARLRLQLVTPRRKMRF